MARRKDDSVDELFVLLMDLPWWVSIALGSIVFVFLRFGANALWGGQDDMAGVLAQVLSGIWWISFIFVVPALISVFRSARKRRMLDSQTSIESIRALSWKQFEQLLGEAYRRGGYTVIENPGAGADGGVDLTLRREGTTFLVQCKNWRTQKVGVKVVREMLGLVTAHGAQGAIVVTSGRFTKEATEFAMNQPIRLINGDDLVKLIGTVQAAPLIDQAPQTPSGKVCPKCGQALVLRTAKRGSHAGNQFWGCSGYPGCRHTESFSG